MSRLQEGGNEKKQNKGGAHKEMLRHIDKEGSEDEDLRQDTQVRENWDC